MSEFAELVDAHYQALFRFGVSLTRDADRAADLVQETFCIWAAKGSQLRDRSNAKTWLFTTLHREFLGQRRRAERFVEEELNEETAAAVSAPVLPVARKSFSRVDALARVTPATSSMTWTEICFEDRATERRGFPPPFLRIWVRTR
jgi:DNA-directed RNA polymerase specialized sigma24 family protein